MQKESCEKISSRGSGTNLIEKIRKSSDKNEGEINCDKKEENKRKRKRIKVRRNGIRMKRRGIGL